MKRLTTQVHLGHHVRVSVRFLVSYIAVIVSLVALFGVVATYTTSHRIDQRFHEAQVAGCERNDDLREGLREYFRSLIYQQEHFDPDLFPQIPRPIFEKLLRQQIHRLEYSLEHRFQAIDCESEYPAP